MASSGIFGQLAGPSSPRAQLWWLTAWLGAEVLACAAVQAPFQRFHRFAFLDSGGELVLQRLMDRGYRPTVDFGHFYGLVPLLVSRAWYGLFGLSPAAFRAETVLCTLVTAWGLARFAVFARLGPAGKALIVLAIPDLMLSSYITLVHALEQALLVLGLAEHARGRRGAALAYATACCFVKPSMGFVYGLVLLIAIALSSRGQGRASWRRGLGPAAATGALLAVVVAAAFGIEPLAISLWPGKGAAMYRASHMGFFWGVGRGFWLLKDARPIDYFRYETGFWLLGTLVLTWGGLVGLWRLARGTSPAGRAGDDEIVATCAALHLAFVTLFFGHRGSWLYYFAVLILGLGVMARAGPRQEAVAWVLARAHQLQETFVTKRQRRGAMLPSSGACGGGAPTAPLAPPAQTCSRRREHGTRPSHLPAFWGCLWAWILAVLLLVSDRSKLVEVRRQWASDAPSATTLGLWATPEERAEWATVLELVRGHAPVLLAPCEGAAVLVPGFAPPAGGYFYPAYALPAEVRRKAAQLATAERIVAAVPPDWHGFADWPELAAPLDDCELVWRGDRIRVYRRRSAPGR